MGNQKKRGQGQGGERGRGRERGRRKGQDEETLEEKRGVEKVQTKMDDPGIDGKRNISKREVFEPTAKTEEELGMETPLEDGWKWRRKIVSNWDRYEEPLEEQEDKSLDTTDFLRGADLKEVLSQTGTGSWFQFKSERLWEEEEAGETGGIFNINAEDLSAALQTIPLHERLQVPLDILSNHMIVALEEDAKAKRETYIPKKQNPLEKVPSPVSVEEMAQRLIGMLLGSTVKKEEQGKVHFSHPVSGVQAVPPHDLTPSDGVNRVEKEMEKVDKDLEELLTLGNTIGGEEGKEGSSLEQDQISQKPVFASRNEVEEDHNLTKCTTGETESRKELEDWLDEYLGD